MKGQALELYQKHMFERLLLPPPKRAPMIEHTIISKRSTPLSFIVTDSIHNNVKSL